MSDFISSTAREDFNKARSHELLTRLVNALTPQNQELLSLRDVKEVLRPKGETYRGMQTVPIEQIIGSEGRYRDFNKGFLPKHEYLRGRWTSIDRAHLKHVNLPAIRLFEIGGVYFVRDGNHRVSVAKSQGISFIDAEVTSLDSEIRLDPSLTRADLRRVVIEYEKENFYRRTNFTKIVPNYDLHFTATGRYDEVLQHVYGHKYFINQHYNEEISFEQALYSWFNNVFKPIVDIIEAEHILSRFPGRTSCDLYMWIVKHWDALKKQSGDRLSMKDAARDFSDRYGRSFWTRTVDYFRRKRDGKKGKQKAADSGK